MTIDRGAIDAQLRDIGEGDRWWEQREFRDIPHVLHDDERIKGIVNGKLLGRRRPRLRPSKPWLIVVTNRRLLCLRQERFARKQVEIPSDEIRDVQQSSGFRSYQVTIRTPARKYRIRIPKDEAFRFSGALSRLVPGSPPRRVNPDLEAWSWIPGFSMFAALPGVEGMVSKVSIAPASETVTRRQHERLEDSVDRLQADVERLQQQVAFLEDLLQERAEEKLLPRSQGES